MADGSNFPPPSGAADQIIAKAIECLDRDIWHGLTDESITIRSVNFWLSDVTIRLDGGVSVLRWGEPSPAYRDAFREAYKNAMARKRERQMQPKLKSISDENFGRKRAGLRVVGSIAGLVIGGTIILATVGGISSCAEQARVAAEADKARDGEVNKYGFKRGNIRTHKVWPNDCASSALYFNNDPSTSRSFQSNYECKSFWENWERDGEIWVDWKGEQ